VVVMLMRLGHDLGGLLLLDCVGWIANC
jgi:hypothetical protein